MHSLTTLDLTLSSKFSSSRKASNDALLQTQTVGLVTYDDYKRKKEALELAELPEDAGAIWAVRARSSYASGHGAVSAGALGPCHLELFRPAVRPFYTFFQNTVANSLLVPRGVLLFILLISLALTSPSPQKQARRRVEVAGKSARSSGKSARPSCHSMLMAKTTCDHPAALCPQAPLS